MRKLRHLHIDTHPNSNFLSFKRKGYKPGDWKYGRGGEVHIWLMPADYVSGEPPGGAQTGAATRMRNWFGRQVYIWGGANDWPKWISAIRFALSAVEKKTKKLKNVTDKTTDYIASKNSKVFHTAWVQMG